MKYLFILGRNIELSIAELKSYFAKIENKILSEKLIKNGFLIELEKEINTEIIKDLGGIVAIGKIFSGFSQDSFEMRLEGINIYGGEKNNFSYAVWNFSEKTELIQEYLKKRFRSEKLRASEKHLTGKIKMQEGEIEYRPTAKTIEEEYFVFGEEEIYFGKIVIHYDSKKVESRDMQKPSRREELAISPRLAKILINLSGVKKDEKLLDPFCGVGVILSEALLQEVKVIGADKDKKAINGAKQNLDWFGFSKDDYELINEDSKKVKIEEADAIATEPDLGIILKKIPTKDKAKKILSGFENLMIDVLINLKDSVKGKIVFTSPYIRIGKKRLTCDIEKIIQRTRLKMLGNGIPEFRKNQVVGRMIYLLEK